MSSLLAAAGSVQAPKIDYKELSPLFALAGGSVIVLMVGLLSSLLIPGLGPVVVRSPLMIVSSPCPATNCMA